MMKYKDIFKKRSRSIVKTLGKKLIKHLKEENNRYDFMERGRGARNALSLNLAADIGVALHEGIKKERGHKLFKPRTDGFNEDDLHKIKNKMQNPNEKYNYDEISNDNEAWKATNNSDLQEGMSRLKKIDPEIHKKESTPEYLKKVMHFSENSKPGDHLILHSKNPNRAILAHELGHARHEGTMHPKLRNLLSHPVTIGASLLGMSVLAPKNKNLRRALVAAPLLTAAPTLYEEARANYHARKNMEELGMYDKEDSQALKDSYKTYLKTVLLPAAVSSAANYAIHRKLSK